MIDQREPIYQWGQRVRAAIAIVNDGSHPGVPASAVIAGAGALGEIVNIGHHADSNTPVYLVEFTCDFGSQLVVGCLEEELVAA